MSLVNKMLRDLDARRASGSDRAGLPAAVTPLAQRDDSGRRASWMLPVAILLAGLIGGVAWYGTRSGGFALTAAQPVAAPSTGPGSAVTTLAESASVAVAVRSPAAALPTLRMAEELLAVPAPRAQPSRKIPATAVVETAARENVVAAAPQEARASPLPKALPLVEAQIDKQTRQPSAAEHAELEYRRALLAQRQGNLEQAFASCKAALEGQPEHAGARQMLAALLIEAKRFDEAEELLRKGIDLSPVRLASVLALARLKVERNHAAAALELLLQHAGAGERSAEFQGFAGALLNRAGRSGEAVERYQAATRLAANEGRWWAGLGIALDASGKGPEAREAYQRARNLPGLPPDLAQHVDQRLR